MTEYAEVGGAFVMAPKCGDPLQVIESIIEILSQLWGEKPSYAEVTPDYTKRYTQ